MKEYNGYPLLEDVENPQLQARNRAVVLFNMTEDLTNERIGEQGIRNFVTHYLEQIPEDEHPAIFFYLKAGVDSKEWRAVNND